MEDHLKKEFFRCSLLLLEVATRTPSHTYMSFSASFVLLNQVFMVFDVLARRERVSGPYKCLYQSFINLIIMWLHYVPTLLALNNPPSNAKLCFTTVTFHPYKLCHISTAMKKLDINIKKPRDAWPSILASYEFVYGNAHFCNAPDVIRPV